MSRQWYPVQPYDDELFSSFVSRCARIHGMSITVFCAVHLPKFQVWTRDVDRSAPDSLVSAVAALASLPPARVQEMTLQGLERALNPRSSVMVGGPGVASWITAVGIYHRIRRRFGLQYCRLCLRESPVFLRAWRLAAVTVCPRHHLLLDDACLHCGAAVVPHRQNPSERHCHACGGDLTHPDPVVGVEADIPRAEERQARFLRALTGKSVVLGGRRVAGGDYVAGLQFIDERLWVLKDRSMPKALREPKVPLELQRPPQRIQTLERLGDLVEDWPRRLCQEAERCGVTRRAFISKDPPPRWITTGLRQLPAGATYDRAKRPRRVRSALRQLHRNRPDGWRTARAQTLLREGGCGP
jgi:hypothetical protein